MDAVSLVLAQALPLFFILDPFAAVGIVSTLIKRFDTKKQNQILRREVFFALLIMLFFYGFGTIFLDILGVSQAAVQITGGIIFFLFALNLLFPGESPIQFDSTHEPFLVPVATPLIAGPSCLATIILYAHGATPTWVDLSAIAVAWAASGLIILLAPKIVYWIGDIGTKVLEQIVGLICAMIAIEMFLSGIERFFELNSAP